ncbi:MAG: succinate dehydrogenase/fumarate reductase iron-sulfur subunit [Deltaproteobacteria bacterium]|nr:succinate dehydrogenase/fumarate reductase iron-sulfur subunit [Deltaproteobacteria bacterium]
MEFTIRVWRQAGPGSKGELKVYRANNVSADSSFIEMMTELNIHLLEMGDEPVAFEADCLEGICGTCSMMIDGVAHGPEKGTTTCQLFMRSFKDGATITVEPFRAGAFPVLKDLVVDRSAFDRIVQQGGFISVNTGNAPDGNAVLVPKDQAETSMDAAECIGCGACVASCKNGSAMLFVSAKAAHFANLPQGQAERYRRTILMVEQMDKEGFGACTNQYECEAVCPKEISVNFIGQLNRDYMVGKLKGAGGK